MSNMKYIQRRINKQLKQMRVVTDIPMPVEKTEKRPHHAEPMTNKRRGANYRAQSGTDKPHAKDTYTGPQRRRIQHKRNHHARMIALGKAK